MARGDYMTGQASIVGWGLNAAASGTRWDGTVGTMRYNKPLPGGANFSIGADQNPDESMDVDATSYTAGATKHSGTIKQFLSYEHQELLLIAMLGAADSVSTSGAPYTHTLALADLEVYLTLALYYENFKIIKFLRTYTNALVTQITITFAPETRPIIEISWVAQSVTASTPGAVPTLNTMTLVDWSEVTLTIDSSTACINSGTLTISRPADDSDITMGCDDPNVGTLFYNGQRTVQLTTELGIDDTMETILAATTTTVTGALVCDNGRATTDNRKITFTFSSLRASTLDTNPATWGKRKESINWAVPTLASVTVINSLEPAQV